MNTSVVATILKTMDKPPTPDQLTEPLVMGKGKLVLAREWIGEGLAKQRLANVEGFAAIIQAVTRAKLSSERYAMYRGAGTILSRECVWFVRQLRQLRAEDNKAMASEQQAMEVYVKEAAAAEAAAAKAAADAAKAAAAAAASKPAPSSSSVPGEEKVAISGLAKFTTSDDDTAVNASTESTPGIYPPTRDSDAGELKKKGQELAASVRMSTSSMGDASMPEDGILRTSTGTHEIIAFGRTSTSLGSGDKAEEDYSLAPQLKITDHKANAALYGRSSDDT